MMVINAAGYRAGEVAAMVGQYLPIIAMQHQYLITEMIPEAAGAEVQTALLRDPTFPTICARTRRPDPWAL